MIVCYFVFQSAFNVLSTLSLIRFLGLKEILASSTFLGAALFCLFLIRKGFSPEKIAASYLAIVVTFVGIALLQVQTSSPLDFYLASALTLNLTIALLILPSSRMQRLTLFLFLLVNGMFFWHLYVHLALGTLTFRAGLLIPAAVINPLFVLVLLAMILRVRAFTQNDIDQEIEWQERNLRLGELSSMTRTFRLLFDRPIKAFQRGIENLRKDPDKVIPIEGDMDELVLLSQSFSWIYRAYRHEEFSTILSTTLLRQLQVLLSSKIKKEGWTFATLHVGSPIEMQGPIPSLVLFLFTVITQLVETPQPDGKRQMTIEFGHEGQMLLWKISWPSPNSKGPDTGLPLTQALNRELIQELIDICKADLQEQEAQSICQLLIRTPRELSDGGGDFVLKSHQNL